MYSHKATVITVSMLGNKSSRRHSELFLLVSQETGLDISCELSSKENINQVATLKFSVLPSHLMLPDNLFVLKTTLGSEL